MRNSQSAAPRRYRSALGRSPLQEKGLLRNIRHAATLGVLLAASGAAFSQAYAPAVNTNLQRVPPNPLTRRASSGSGPVALPDDFSRVRLTSGFTLQMEVFGIPEMTQTLAVDKDGFVVVPLVGPILVAGKTTREAERAIAAALEDKEIVNSPTVTLTVSEFAPQGVVVAGEVQNPGELHVLGPRPLLRVIEDAGGVTTSAGGDIEVRHRETDGTETVRHVPYFRGRPTTEAEHTMVAPGDTIFIARAGTVFVLGAVTHPGSYLMVHSGTLNLPEAVGLAEGFTLVSSPRTVVVVRTSDDQVHTYNLRLDKMSRGEVPAFPLVDGDMVYVPTSGVKSTLVTYSAILSAAANAGIIASTGR